MADVQTNRASFTLAVPITSSGQAAITRSGTGADGLPGDNNGPASGTYKFVMADAAGNLELAQVTGGQGTTGFTIARAVELIGEVQTALASVPAGTVCYAVATAGDIAAAVAAAQAAAESASDPAGTAATAAALALQKASNLSDLASAATARTNLGLGSAAVDAASAFDAAGAAAAAQSAAEAASDPSGSAATAQSNAETFATSAVGTETTRAETAEALLAPLASPALTGSPTAPTRTPGDASTNIATDAFAAAAILAAQPDLAHLACQPAAALYDNFDRSSASGNVAPGTGGLYLNAIWLPAGLPIGHIAFMSIAANVTPTHWWFGLYDNNRNQLATTADQTTTAWAATALTSLAIAQIASGASATFTTPYTGFYYLGIMQTASPPATVVARTSAISVISLTPVLAGKSDLTQTTPPAFPYTATTITVPGSSCMYGYVAT